MKKVSVRSRRAKYRRRVYQVLKEQNFIIGEKEKKLIEARISNGRRYFFMVAKRKEKGKIIDRFIKIPANDNKELLTPFCRQIEFAKYVKAHDVIHTRGVVASNYDLKKGIPFAIMETFPSSYAKIGFIEENEGAEMLRAREAKRTIDQLEKFHAVPAKSLPRKLRKILKVHPGDYESFRREILSYLNRKVRPIDGRREAEPLWHVLERRLKISGIKGKTKELLDRTRAVIDSKANRGLFLVHGDMAPNNLYVFNSGDVELLDLEWVGTFKNKAIAMILDFGNLRSRSWVNERFRNALDAYLVKTYRSRGQERLGEAIVKLSILRSHFLHSGFFENYEPVRQKDPTQICRRTSTEKDILKAFKE